MKRLLFFAIAFLVGCAPDWEHQREFGVISRIEPVQFGGWAGGSGYVLHTSNGKMITVGQPSFTIGDTLRTYKLKGSRLWVQSHRGNYAEGS